MKTFIETLMETFSSYTYIVHIGHLSTAANAPPIFRKCGLIFSMFVVSIPANKNAGVKIRNQRKPNF